MRILVVDDSRTMRMLVSRTLRQAGYGGHEILEAADGVEALEIVHRGGIDVVLCDWNMPRMTGLELLQALRGSGDLHLFGFITSEGTADMREVAEQEGASFVISKPFTVETFQAVLGGTGGVAPLFLHEGLPTVRQLQAVLETLLGRSTETAASTEPVTADEAAITFWYAYGDGRLGAAGALDLDLAAALGTGFGMLPPHRRAEAIATGVLEPDQFENVREVVNVLVAVYRSVVEEHLSLVDVRPWAVLPPAPGEQPPAGKDGVRRPVTAPDPTLPDGVTALLAQATGRLDARVSVPGYGTGRLSLVFARR